MEDTVKNITIDKFIVYWSANDNWSGWQEIQTNNIEVIKNKIVSLIPMVIFDEIQITKIIKI